MLVSFSVPLLRQPIVYWEQPKIQSYIHRVYWYSLMLVDGERSIRDIAWLLHLPYLHVYNAMRDLEQRGIIVNKQDVLDARLWDETQRRPAVQQAPLVKHAAIPWYRVLRNTLRHWWGVKQGYYA